MSNAIVEFAGKRVTFCDVSREDYIEGMLSGGRWYELSNLEFIRGLGIDGNYVDVGAYIGTHSVFFSLFCRASIVYSFEPQRDIYGKLLENLEINGIKNCLPFNLALSNHGGFCEISNHQANRGGGELCESTDPSTIPMITLDSLGLKDISVMKIDVEQAEMNVLEGSQETLKQVKHLFIELWGKESCANHKVECMLDSVVDFLSKRGFVHQSQQLDDELHYFKRIV